MRIRKKTSVDISAEINDIGDLLTVAPRTDSIPPVIYPDKKKGRRKIKRKGDQPTLINYFTDKTQEQIIIYQQEADTETLDFIADRVEGNLLAAYQEVQKLALLFPQGTITFDQVREAVLDVARYDVFNLGEIMLEGDPLRVARVLYGLQGEGTAAPLVLWSLSEEIRAIGKIITGVNGGKPASMMMREARIWGPSHQNAMQNNLRRFTLGQVTEALRHAAVIDRMVKGLVRGDVWDELLQLALRFARNNPGTVKAQAPRRTSTAAFAAHPALF